jgi:hypothetical protein
MPRSDVLDDRQVAALGVGIVAVEVAAEDEAALVGLADVEVAGIPKVMTRCR